MDSENKIVEETVFLRSMDSENKIVEETISLRSIDSENTTVEETVPLRRVDAENTIVEKTVFMSIDSENTEVAEVVSLRNMDSENKIVEDIVSLRKIDSENTIFEETMALRSMDSENTMVEETISLRSIDSENMLVEETVPSRKIDSKNTVIEGICSLSSINSENINIPKINIVESLEILQKSDSMVSSSSSDSDSDSEDSSEDSDSKSGDDDSQTDDGIQEKTVVNINRREQEEESWQSVLGVDKVSTELPDISSLDLSDKEQFIYMGNFESVIDKIVTVAALPQMPAYDLETLLFLDEGQRVLGYIFDVMGPVTAPVYIIPMKSAEAIAELQLKKGDKVYCAPRSKYTKYILLQELMNIRGSDASWIGDVEVPPEFQEYSDDEQERLKKKDTKRKRCPEKESEAKMDRLPGGRKTIEQQPRRSSYPQNRDSPTVAQNSRTVVNPVAIAAQNFNNTPMIPIFNPSIPPPNIRIPHFYAPPVGGMIPPFPSSAPHPIFWPTGTNFNESPNRPNFRQNMPGPSDGNWFHR